MTKRPATPPYAGDPPPAIRQKQSLRRIVSILSDEEHKKLDGEITEKMLTWQAPLAEVILIYITKFSNGTLKMLEIEDAHNLIALHEELGIELEKAWETKEYKAIRELGETSANNSIHLLI